MSFWKRGTDAATVGFFGGIGAAIGNLFINKLGSGMRGVANGTDQEATAGSALLEDLQSMPEIDTANLRRRWKEALGRNEQDRLATLLLRIPNTTGQSRQPLLKYLNDLSDEEFIAMMQLLAHPQSTSEKLAGHISALTGKIAGTKRGDPRA